MSRSKTQRLRLRAELVESAVAENDAYRDLSNPRDLEIGYLYGQADLIVNATIGPDESFSDLRTEIAEEIDRRATEKYPLLPVNGYKGPE